MPLLDQKICELLGVGEPLDVQRIQTLWSGCGQIAKVRWGSGEGQPGRAVVKHVQLPDQIDHPRGWNTDRSAQRKARSYEVEMHWYAQWSQRCTEDCRVPRYLGHTAWGGEQLLVLEDIDAAGYPRRVTQATLAELDACVRWLAVFHGTFMSARPEGLWDKGTYWHLQTRPDEWDAMPDGPLKRAAAQIDTALDASPFQTVVHGDAKLANFCFTAPGNTPGNTSEGISGSTRGVVAVDFQYVGGGCGMKDLAYLVGGCLGAEDCFREEERVLGVYFEKLRRTLERREMAVDAEALEEDWRRLYPYAWADFQRFLVGWSPGHWKLSTYSEHMTRLVLEGLQP